MYSYRITLIEHSFKICKQNSVFLNMKVCVPYIKIIYRLENNRPEHKIKIKVSIMGFKNKSS